MKSEMLAHISADGRKQTVKVHMENTAKIAMRLLNPIGLGNVGYIAGLLHDVGKLKEEFQEYLVKAVKGEPVKRGSVNHTFAAVRLLLESYHNDGPDTPEDITSEMLAYAVGAHHGLFDLLDENKNMGFKHRVDKEGIYYEECIENLYANVISKAEMEKQLKMANDEIAPVYDILIELCEGRGSELDQGREMTFYMGLTARLILSAVIEGDRGDTAAFMSGREYLVPHSPDWNAVLDHMEDRLSKLPCDKKIDISRKKISDIAAEFADKPSGIYRLNLPTGGGKTLTSLRYALRHCHMYKKKRIIFTAPLLTIIEQNSEVIKSFVGDDMDVLEHHSNVIDSDLDYDELDERELYMENWSAPIIITTMVQLLNTFFSGKTSSIRRFCSLTDSVIVIDEVQSVPEKMISIFNLAMNYLAAVCKCTVVLCSATQPSFEITEHSLLGNIENIVPYDDELWEVFKRTRLENAGIKSLDDIIDMAQDILNDVDSLLIVCNKKDEASYLFEGLNAGTCECFYMSASLCAQHRRDTLGRIYESLRHSRSKTVCVSTQVIEAGVDISFQRVIRFMAGMDSVVQSAGRCNRNGESDGVEPVYVVNCAGENLGRLKEINAGKTASIHLFEQYRTNPGKFDHSFFSDYAIKSYYENLYGEMPKEYMDYVVDKPRTTILSLLSDNSKLVDNSIKGYGRYYLNQSFKLAGERFRVFDENTKEVLVPYGEGIGIIEDLCSENACYDVDFVKECIQKAKSFTISIYLYQYQQLLSEGGIYEIEKFGILILKDGYYDSETGFSLKGEKLNFLSV